MSVSGVLGIYNCLQQITKLLSEDADCTFPVSGPSVLSESSKQNGLWPREGLNPDAVWQIPDLKNRENEIIQSTLTMVSENNLGSCEGILKHNHEIYPAFNQVLF